MEITREQIDELRQHHIGRLLLQAHRQFSTQAIEKLAERGHTSLGIAHTNVLANLDLAGTRITTLAERVGVTKQAVSTVVAELETKGYLETSKDPADGRAILITYTEAGWNFLRDAHEVKREIEAEYQTVLGAEGLQTLRTLLQGLIQV